MATQRLVLVGQRSAKARRAVTKTVSSCAGQEPFAVRIADAPADDLGWARSFDVIDAAPPGITPMTAGTELAVLRAAR